MARVAVRQGLQSQSFELAAEGVSDAVGCSISGESVRQVTEGWGQTVDEVREAERKQLFAENGVCELPKQHDPIEHQASISTDGGMVHIRNKGWKECKMVVVSSVRPKTTSELTDTKESHRYAPYEQQMMLERHSYQAGMWLADQAGEHQYTEAVRRDIPNCLKMSAVADGAPWIERITKDNFPDITQIVDWFHLTEKLWFIGSHYFSDKEARQQWVNLRLNELWVGETDKSIIALAALPTPSDEAIATALGYVERQQHRLNYPRYRIACYPIGSGSVESGINTVVHHRMKRQGRGWDWDHAHHMLAALSALNSKRFSTLWQQTQVA